MVKFAKKTYWFLLPIAISIIMMLFNNVKFSMNDDVLASEISKSFEFNSNSEFIIIINIIYGYVIKFLFNVIHYVDWYSITYLFMVTGAFILCLKLIEKYGSQLALIIALNLIQIYILYNITFSCIAFLCVTVGLIWLFDNVKKVSKSETKDIIIGFLFVFFGLALRNAQIFYVTFLVFVPVSIMAGYGKRNTVRAIILIMSSLLVFHFGLNAFNNVYQKSIPDDLYYNQFAKYRAKVTDHGLLNYSEHAEELLSNGISENDVNMYFDYLYTDRQAFSEEKLQAMVNCRGFNDKYDMDIIGIFKSMFVLDHIFVNFVFWYLLAAAIAFALFKKRRLEIFMFSAMIFAGVFYIFFRRRGVARMYNSMAICGLLYIIYLFACELKDIKISKKVPVIASLVLLMCGGLFVCNNYADDQWVKEYASYFDEASEYINNDSENIYLSDAETTNEFMEYRLSFNVLPSVKTKIYNIFGEWYSYSYYYYALLDKLGLSEYSNSPMLAVTESNVRLVSNKDEIPEEIKIFAMEHYGRNINYEVEKSFATSGVKIYKFSEVN